MRMERRAWARGAVTLAVAGGMVVAVVMFSPAGAAAPVTKKIVKKIATKLDRSIAGRVGFAFDSTNDRQLDAGATGAEIEQLTTSVTAPAPGFLVLDLWMDNFNLGSLDYFLCYARVDGTKVQSSVVLVGVENSSQTFDNCSSHAVVPVDTGAHTVALVTDDVDSLAVRTDEIGVSAVYVPYTGTGGRPTSFTVA